MLADARLGHYFVEAANGQPGSIADYTPREFSALGLRAARTHRPSFGLLAPSVRAEAVRANHFGTHAVDLCGNGVGRNVLIHVDHERCLRAIIGAPADADAENRWIRHQAAGVLFLNPGRAGHLSIGQWFFWRAHGGYRLLSRSCMVSICSNYL